MNTRGVRWLVALLLGILFGVAFADTASAAPAAASTLTGYTYYGHHCSVDADQATSERGPPRAVLTSAADQGSCGAWARPQLVPNLTDTTYYHPVRFARADSASATTQTASDGRPTDMRAVPGASVAD